MKVLEISKEDLKHNIKIIKEQFNEKVKLIAVVKANGIGLGLIEYSKFLIENGIEYLAVATVEEALKLRNEIKEIEIIMLTPTIIEKELKSLIENDITITIGNVEGLILAEKVSNELKKDCVKAHLKIDTGFARYGFMYFNKEYLLDAFKVANNVKILGTYTHFSNPKDEKWTNIQFERFIEVVNFLKENGCNPGIIHCASSTAALKYPQMALDAVRIGSALQGRTLNSNTKLIKIGKFKTSVTEIKMLPKGYNISYGNTYKTSKETKIAIIPVGYIDGLNKAKLRDDYSLKNNIIAVLMEIKKIFKDNSIKVKIKGNTYKIIGRLGMYHCIADITNSDDINIGDEVLIDIPPLQVHDEIRREYI